VALSLTSKRKAVKHSANPQWLSAIRGRLLGAIQGPTCAVRQEAPRCDKKPHWLGAMLRCDKTH
jgi:hypothetical protein